MKITRIDLTNFASHAESTFHLRDHSYFVGHNNAGKSSVIDALTWALTGKCRGLDGANRDIRDLIRDGARKGLGVRVEIDGFGEITRQTDGKDIFLKIKDWTGSNRAQQAEFYSRTGITEEVLAACLDSSAFLSLHHHDAKRLLFGVLDVKIGAAELEPLGIVGPIGLDELDEHYKKAFDERTRAKNLMEAHAIQPEPDGDEPPEPGALRAQVDALREQERALVAQGGEQRGRYDELAKAIAKLADEDRTLRTRIGNAGDPHAELDKVEAEIAAIPEDDDTAAPDLFAEPAPSPVETEIETLKQRLVDERGQLRILEGVITGSESHDPARGCVLNAGVPCLTPAAEFKASLATARKDSKRIDKAIEVTEARLRGLEKQIAADRQIAGQKQIDANKRRDLRATLAKRKQGLLVKITAKQGDEARLADVLTERARLQAEQNGLGEPKEPEGLAELQARIRRGDGIVNDARDWHEAMKRHNDSKAAGAHLVEKVADLEQRVTKLGPKGLVLSALEAARDRFERSVNSALERFGYRLEFQFDPWTVLVNGRKSVRLSESERLRVGIALQLAIATIAGVGFAAIDRVDMLDAENRALLQDVIDAFPGQLIAAATKDPNGPLPDVDTIPDDSAFFVLALEDNTTHARDLRASD